MSRYHWVWTTNNFGSDEDPNYLSFLCYTFDGGESWEGISPFGMGKLSPELVQKLGLGPVGSGTEPAGSVSVEGEDYELRTVLDE